MKRLITFLALLLATGSLALRGTDNSHSMPRINGERGSQSLVVDGRPYIILGGELGNSTASDPTALERIFPRLKAMGLNTVLTPAYWDLCEPEEGQFDFSLVDKAIEEARKNDLRIVFLWFGAWKNSMSCYAPLWVKQDSRRFPRCRTSEGKPLEIATPFNDKLLAADSKAFKALLAHIKEVDSEQHTVIMMQVENEIGMLENARDYSNLAEKQYKRDIPAGLGAYLSANAGSLHPELAAIWQAAGAKTSGSWSEVFGSDAYGEEIFMAWHYASYVQKMIQAGREVYDLPMYVNAAMNSRGRKPGQYPSAGPLAHLKDIWICAAPGIDFLAPDLYDSGYKDWLAKYDLPDNTLFIPEIRLEPNDGARALYAFGEHDALGFSPFSIENASPEAAERLRKSYTMLSELTPLIEKCRDSDDMRAVLFTREDDTKTLIFGHQWLVCSHFFTLPWDSRATDGSTWPEAAAIIIRLAPDEFIVAGSGIVVEFRHENEQTAISGRGELGEDGFATSGSAAATNARWKLGFVRTGLGTVDEVHVNPDGSFTRISRHCGDQTHQGRHARIGVDDFSILHIKLYEYK